MVELENYDLTNHKMKIVVMILIGLAYAVWSIGMFAMSTTSVGLILSTVITLFMLVTLVCIGGIMGLYK
ncbi:hypothetical protein phiOC_p078 [Ochrobactrum phage vB_OspM_OC]|nr:hypothetical protein phiOC_p078 [Ochrobactrum phage vB_OspM_OC]